MSQNTPDILVISRDKAMEQVKEEHESAGIQREGYPRISMTTT